LYFFQDLLSRIFARLSAVLVRILSIGLENHLSALAENLNTLKMSEYSISSRSRSRLLGTAKNVYKWSGSRFIWLPIMLSFDQMDTVKKVIALICCQGWSKTYLKYILHGLLTTAYLRMPEKQKLMPKLNSLKLTWTNWRITIKLGLRGQNQEKSMRCCSNNSTISKSPF
jgi:hypothetical protein